MSGPTADGGASGPDGRGAVEGSSNAQRRAGDGKRWPAVADLRVELAQDTPQLTRLVHPLPARVIELMPGKADLDLIDLAGDSFGLMVLEGLLLVELASGKARIGWLVGAGDLVRPSGMRELALTERSRWRALSDSRLAVLDRDFAVRARGIPIVWRALVNRATRTTNWLLAKSLIISSPLIEERLLLLFALLGERWGKVTPEGIALRLPLTHQQLATLCGARRPSVTMALHSLQREGLINRPTNGTWLLRRSRSNHRSHPTCSADYERALGLASSTWSQTALPMARQLHDERQHYVRE